MTDTSLNPSGAGFFNQVANGAVRQQYVVDSGVSGSSPIGTVVELEAYAGPGSQPRSAAPLIQPSTPGTPGSIIGAISPGTDLGSTMIPPGSVATVTICGVCQVLCDASTVSGEALVQSPTTAGCAQTSAYPVTRTLGLCLQTVTISSGTALVWCYIDPGSQSGAGGGPQGPQGYQGTQGYQGYQGATGAGTQGAQGATGDSVPQGSTGATGAQGPQGNQGTQGSQGAMGPQGSQGNQGNQGFQGNQGTQGTQGTQGLSDHYQSTSSTSLTLGSGTQTLTVGTGLAYTVGQTAVIAYDATHYMTGTVVSYTSGSGVLVVSVTTVVGAGTFASWTVNLDGATGVQGNQGSQGTQGVQGSQGNQGSQGTQGVQGAQGTQGSQGATGSQGTQGNQGSTGSTGAQGAQGAAGVTGPQGPQGSPGNQGASTGSLTPATPTVTVATPNTVTVAATSRVSNVQNASANSLQITMSTSGAVDAALVEVRIYDYSNVAQTLTWVNTENASVTVPTSSNGSTTLPLSVLFQYNAGGTAGGTSKWRCLSVS
jgi:hypothetical protein